MELSCSARLDSPLILPPCFASTIVPVTLEPDGITVRPWLTTGWATTAWKVCPAWLLLALMASVVRIEIVVPVGKTTGAGAGLGVGFSATGGAWVAGLASSAAVGAGVGLGGVLSELLCWA